MRREHPEGTTILVLGILSIAVCGLLGPFAWVKGNRARREIAANPDSYSNAGPITAGWICGIIGSVLSVLWVIMAIIWIVAVVSFASSLDEFEIEQGRAFVLLIRTLVG